MMLLSVDEMLQVVIVSASTVAAIYTINTVAEHVTHGDCNMCGYRHRLHKCGRLRLCRECMDAYEEM